MNRNPLFALLVLSLPPLAACGDGTVEAAGPIVRDSAGITIVENTAPVWGEGEGWRISEQPVLEIGMLDGPEEYQLFRVSGAIRLPDDRIVVANGGTHQLRFYNSGGLHLLSAGQQGGGPGEFEGMGPPVAIGADSLLVPDWRLGHISVFGIDGSFVRSFPLPSVGGGPPASLVGSLSDGSLLLAQSPFGGTPGELESGIMRDSINLFRYDPDAERLDTIGTFSGSERFIQMEETGENRMIMVIRFPFFRGPHTAAADQGFYHGASDRYEIGLYGSDGTLQRLIRREHRLVPAEGEYIDRFLEEREQEADDSRPAGPMDDALSEVPLPPSLPAYSRILADAEGNLWVEPFRWPGDEQAYWDVFDPDGKLLGSVLLPPDFRPTHIGADFVLGVATDDLEVEYVRMYELRKPESGRPSPRRGA